MAYTKTPDFNTHQIKRIPIQASPYPTASLGQYSYPNNSPRYFNCFPTTTKQFNGNPKISVQPIPPECYPNVILSNYYYYFTTAPYRGNVQGNTGLAKVFGNQFWTGPQGTTTSLTGAITDTYPIYSDTLVFGTTVTRFFISTPDSGPTVSTLYYSTNEWNTVNSVVLPFVAFGAPVVIDGYVFVIGKVTGGSVYTSSQRIFNCALGDITSWPATSYIDAEQFSDGLISLGKIKNYLVAFGNESIEFFYDAATELGSPLQRQESYASHVGLYNYYNTFNTSIIWGPSGELSHFCSIGEKIYFIGIEYKTKAVGLYCIDNMQVSKVGGTWLQALIQSKIGSASTLYPVSFNGTAGILFKSDIAVSTGTYFIVPDEDYVFCELSTLNTLVGYGPTTSSSSSGGLLTSASAIYNDGTRWVIIYFASSALLSLENGYNPVTRTSYYFTDLLDHDSQNPKHIKWLDVIGDFNAQSGSIPTIAVAYNTADNMLNFTNTTTLTPVDSYPTRFRNFGSARKHSFKITITGAYTNWRLDGLEIAYNIGQY
jgi:hypothetical protein